MGSITLGNCTCIMHVTRSIFTSTQHDYIITRIIKNISNKNERRCRDVKTQKACEQG